MVTFFHESFVKCGIKTTFQSIYFVAANKIYFFYIKKISNINICFNKYIFDI